MGFTPTDFLTTMAFATFVIEVCGLDFLLALDFVFRPRPSSLYTFFLLWPPGLPIKAGQLRYQSATDKKLGSGLPPHAG